MRKISLDKDAGDVAPLVLAVQADACLPVGSTIQKEDRQKPTVADVLLRHGLWPTRRDTRLKFAGEVEALGLTADQVDLLCSSILSMAGDRRIGLGECVNLLRDRERAMASLEDLSRVAPVGRKWHPGEADRQRSAEALGRERQVWADADRQHYIRCRVADGIPEAEARAEWAAAHGEAP